MAAVEPAATSDRCYTGRGVVGIGRVRSVILSAEPTTQAQMPIPPVLTVLASPRRRM
jgi:hypothetical protein